MLQSVQMPLAHCILSTGTARRPVLFGLHPAQDPCLIAAPRRVPQDPSRAPSAATRSRRTIMSAGPVAPLPSSNTRLK